MKIYIAGPYSADTEEEILANVNAAIDAGIRLYRKGHHPYIPHLTHYVDLRAPKIGETLRWEDYMAWDMPWVRVCDGLLYLRSSRGADLELQEARKLGKRIFVREEDVPDAGKTPA